VISHGQEKKEKQRSHYYQGFLIIVETLKGSVDFDVPFFRPLAQLEAFRISGTFLGVRSSTFVFQNKVQFCL
jgi:hypothetical protein